MSFYANQHFANISKNLMDHYMIDAVSNNLTNTKTLNLTGGSIRRQYEYIPRSFIENREAEGRKPILNATNVITPSNYNFGGAANFNGGIVYRTRGMKGGDFFSDLGNFFKPVASAALDLAAPAIGTFLGGPTGAVLATGARQGLKNVTGFGKGKRGGKKKGVGVYGGSMNASAGAMSGGVCLPCAAQQRQYGGCDGDMTCAPCAKKSKAGAKTAGAMSAAGKKKGNRMDMVKKVMKEKGLSLGAASKFIAENNLYKKKTDK